jgi:hypothetical protein
VTGRYSRHCYRIIASIIGGYRVTFPLYTAAELTPDELRTLAIAQAVRNANDSGDHDITAADVDILEVEAL